MFKFEQGLVVGKFYPPHVGHEYLIRSAEKQSSHVTVLVLGSLYDSVSIEERVLWLQQSHPNVTVVGAVCEVPVDYNDKQIWDAQVAIMAGTLPCNVDAVFSSEPYGQELAERFNATPVFVDTQRLTHPISGVAVRQDLHKNWGVLPESTRQGLTLRVVLLGAESSGTTTLTEMLREYYGKFWDNTLWVPEYGREYTEQKLNQLNGAPEAGMENLTWSEEDFRIIAEKQTEHENFASQRGGPVLFCDTDAYATAVWEHRYLHEKQKYGCSFFLCKTSECFRLTTSYTTLQNLGTFTNPSFPKRRLYLLTDDVGVPFKQDGVRDGEHLRHQMTSWFVEMLCAENLPWVLLTGSLDERFNVAVRSINEGLLKTQTFYEPVEPR